MLGNRACHCDARIVPLQSLTDWYGHLPKQNRHQAPSARRVGDRRSTGAIAPVTPRRTQLTWSTDARPAGSIDPTTHRHSATNASQERSDSPVLDLGYTAHTPADDAWLCPSHARNSARHSKLTHSRSIATAITVGHSGGCGAG